MTEWIIEAGEHSIKTVGFIVRCEKCEWWREDPYGKTYCELTAVRCDGEHFCSWGIQKDET
ncbi:MAG: hypothetical protein J6S67_15695 [Methanobrevibacter sp.]|nr:hypothetical protein [Methanobrevibacter sp.]